MAKFQSLEKCRCFFVFFRVELMHTQIHTVAILNTVLLCLSFWLIHFFGGVAKSVPWWIKPNAVNIYVPNKKLSGFFRHRSYLANFCVCLLFDSELLPAYWTVALGIVCLKQYIFPSQIYHWSSRTTSPIMLSWTSYFVNFADFHVTEINNQWRSSITGTHFTCYYI